MLYIFDKDGTLVREINGKAPLTPQEQILLPGVREKIIRLRDAGHKIAIASNQGGVAKGIISFGAARRLLEDVCCKIGGADAFIFCPHYPGMGPECFCRKPKPGMLLHLIYKFEMRKCQTVMVGNSDVDKQAAEGAGCNFLKAWDFWHLTG